MTNEQLNHYFSKNYDSLTEYGSKAISHFRRKLDTTWLLSECYLYLVDNITLLNTESDVQSFSKNWIKTNLKWKTTPIMRMAEIKSNDINIDYIDRKSTITHSSDHIITLIEEFRLTLSTYDRRLFNIWWDLDLRKVNEVANYLEISSSGAYRIIKECRELELKLEKYIRKNII